MGRLTNGAVGTVVISRSRDKAAFLASGLPAPSRGTVYQLWSNDGGTMRGAGLLRPVRRRMPPAPTSEPLALMNFPGA